ncbi:MAG TPA: hypothetical protein DEB06_08800 [Phycisphaerales bacterium]|nr:hypothetical protein [Phycisphaerales bacterium]
MTQKSKPRLGRGLSALIGQPVQVEVAQREGRPDPIEPSSRGSKPAAELSDLEPGDGRRLVSLAVGEIVVSRYQPRQTFDEASIGALAASIRSAGLMQPLLVRAATGPGKAGRFELVAGERRWRAAQRAGLLEVPAIVVSLSEQEAAEWALIENLQREDLNPIDRAQAFRGLTERFGLTQAEIASRVGIDRSSVANTVRLLELEPDVRTLVARGELSLGHAKALLAGPSGDARLAAAVIAVRDGWTVRDTERWATNASAARSVAQESEGASRPVDQRGAAIAEVERQLGEFLGTRVRVKRSKSSKKGRLEISFYSDAHFNGLMEKMGFTLVS